MTGLLSFMGGALTASGWSVVSPTLKHQAWRLLLENQCGRIQHAFVAFGEISGPPIGRNGLVDCIAGATFTSTDTPIGPPETLRFASGLAIVDHGACPSRLVFNTSDLRPSDLIVLSARAGRKDGRLICPRVALRERDIDGCIRRRLEMTLFEPESAAPIAIDTAAVADGDYVKIDFVGFMK